jgi:hypothetical protein
MADIQHKDVYKIKDATATIGVRVRMVGGHSAAWVVTIRDKPVPPQPDGFVALGVGSDLRAKVVVVTINLVKIARGKKFTVELEMREISASGGATTPLEIKKDFGNANTVDVVETITFE